MQRLPLRHQSKARVSNTCHPANRCAPQRARKGGFLEGFTAPPPQLTHFRNASSGPCCLFLCCPQHRRVGTLLSLESGNPRSAPAPTADRGEAGRLWRRVPGCFRKTSAHLPVSPANRGSPPFLAPPVKTRCVLCGEADRHGTRALI